MDQQSCPAPASPLRKQLTNLAQLPSRILLGSSLILLSFLQDIHAQRELTSILSTMKKSYRTNQEAKQELLRYTSLIQSTNTRLCPVMLKELSEEQYEKGILINGDYSWASAMRQIRQQLKLPAHMSVTFLCGKDIVGGGTVQEVFEKYVDGEDGMMYVQYVQLESYG